MFQKQYTPLKMLTELLCIYIALFSSVRLCDVIIEELLETLAHTSEACFVVDGRIMMKVALIPTA